MKKLLSLLSLCTVLLAAYSCGETGVPAAGADAPDVPESTADTAATETQTAELKPEFEDVSYGGRAFNAYVIGDYENEIYTETETGSVENDVLYRRNRAVEELYDVKIVKPVVDNEPNRVQRLEKQILAGDDFCQLIDIQAYVVHSLIMKDCILNWYDVNGIDLTQPWWNTLSNEISTINGKLYMASGALNLSTITWVWCMFYNPVLLEQYDIGVDTIQNAVIDGKWTMDFFEKTVTDLYEDINGDSKRDEDDLYGYMAFWSSVDPTFTVFGSHMTDRNENGDVVINYMNEKTVDMFTRMYNMIYQNSGSYAAPEDWAITRTHFVNGTVAFIPGIMEFAKMMTDMKDGYGIIPYPKWNEEQELYYTSPSDGASMIGIPVTADISDNFIGNITEALNYYSYKDVIPVNLDVLLKGRYSLDANTAKIIDLFIGNRVYEFATQFSEPADSLLYRLNYFMRDQISRKKPDIASAYARIEEKLNKGLNKILEHYED